MRAPQVIVADHRDSADILVAMLGAQGFDARAAYDGLQAIELAAELKPEAVISDLSLPAVSGIDVALSLRSRFGPSIRLVAYTGWSDARHHERALRAGFDSYILKPADTPTLVDALSPETLELYIKARYVSQRRLELLLDLAEKMVVYRRNAHLHGDRMNQRAYQRILQSIRAGLDRGLIPHPERTRMLARLLKLTGDDSPAEV